MDTSRPGSDNWAPQSSQGAAGATNNAGPGGDETREQRPAEREIPQQGGWVLGPPSAAMDRSVPQGVCAQDLAQYCLMLGDDALLMAHRLSGWGVRGPDLEESSALATITVELLGQARALLARAGDVEGAGRDPDQLAYHRDSEQFRNVRLAEIDCGPGPGGDFATTIARLLLFAAWRQALFEQLAGTRDPVLSAIAVRSWRDLRRHREHAAQWVIRLGDGSSPARRRMLAALHRVWPLAGELFAAHPVELELAQAGCAVHPDSVRTEVAAVIDETLSVARLHLPDLAQAAFAGSGGRFGVHTESMPFVLAEMQHLVRADPPESW